MPAHVSFGPVKDKIPAKWISLDICNLTPDVSGKYAFLKIKHRHKHHVCRVNRLKMLLEDGDGNVVDFFSLGQVADDLKACEKGDFLLCLEFEVEETPGHYSLPYQIIADDTGEKKSLIWVSKTSANHVSPSTPRKAGNRDILVLPRTLSSAEKKRCRSYNYLKLSEVKINTVVDAYGVVKFVKPAVKGKGSDYYCVVGLTDPSIFDKEEEKLVCVFFHRDLNSLPKVEEGDILRLHRLKIQTYQGGKQGYNGPGFQWLAFHGSLDARTFSTLGYTFEEQDEELANHLLEWWSKLPGGDLQAPQTSTGTRLVRNTTTLANVNPKDFFDLVCQVVQVCELEPDVCRLIRVWDGTKFEGQLKIVLEGELNQTLKEDNKLVKISTGFVVDIFAFDNHAKESASIKPGDFLLLTNVHASVVSGLVELTVHGGGQKFSRGIQVLPSDSTEAQNLKKKLDTFVAQTSGGSNNCAIEDYSDQSSLTAIPDQNKKTINSLAVAQSQGCTVGKNSNEKDKVCPNLDSPCTTCEDQPIEVSPRKAQIFQGRKDVPSKNKSLRHRMLYNIDNFKGSSTQIFNMNSKGTTNLFGLEEEVCHPATGKALSVTEVVHEDKLSDSSQDSNQSIWLSIYNDRVNERNNLKPLLSPSLQKDFVRHEGNSADDSKEETLEDRSIGKGEHPNTIGEDDHLSSQDSFVTVPSPSACHQFRPAGMNISESLPDKAEKSSQAEKRSAHQLSSYGLKRIKLLSESPQDEKRISEEKAKETPMENAEDKDMKDTSNNDVNIILAEQENDKNPKSLNYEKELYAFSQDHLEILESQMLYFDSNAVFQAATVENNDQNLQQRAMSVSFTPRENTFEKINIKHRERKKERKVCSVKESKISQQNEPDPNNKLNDTEKTQPPSYNEVIDVNEGSQASQDNQDFLQTDPGESQVTSSTDSLKSSSEPRCMLKTASVVLDHCNLCLSTIQDVLDQPPPRKFRIQARVERMEPRLSSPHDLVHFLCPQCKFFTRLAFSARDSELSNTENKLCPNCVQSPSTMRAVSVLVLQLSDKHNSISASVWDKNADQLFGGISPQQILSDPSSFQHVQQQLNDLCPLGSSLESRPVLECCVCSYYVDGDVKIQIFDTSLV